jgi:hypothetical protein
MAYSSSIFEFPPLAKLSLNHCHRPTSRTSHMQSLPSHSNFTFTSYQLHEHCQQHLSPSGQYSSRWSVPEWQASLDRGSNSVPPLYSNTEFEKSSWGTMLPTCPKSNMDSLFLPRLPLLDLDREPPLCRLPGKRSQPNIFSAVSSSPSDTSSSVYSGLSPSPSPSIHVVCDIPVVAPRPLPYHSPTFLQFDLPDIDEDLSRPPYTRGPAKRKRETDDDFDEPTHAKRHAASSPGQRLMRSRSAMQGKATRVIHRQMKR